MSDPTFDFTGARVLVTGARSGIGAALALAFAEAGAELIVTGTRSSAADYDAPVPGTYRRCRMTESGDIDDLAGFVDAELGALDVLVNNAERTCRADATSTTPTCSPSRCRSTW